MKKVLVDVKVRLVLSSDNKIGDDDIDRFISEMEYSFSDQTGIVNIAKTEIRDYDIVCRE